MSAVSEEFNRDFDRIMRTLDCLMIWLGKKYPYHIIMDVKLKLENKEGFLKVIEKNTWSYFPKEL